MKDVLKQPCDQCPFRRRSIRGWLGAYASADEFIAIHHDQDQQNPCHRTIDYEDPDWRANLPDATACVGQQIFYRNSLKNPRHWAIPEGVQRDDGVFRTPHEFRSHHLDFADRPLFWMKDGEPVWVDRWVEDAPKAARRLRPDGTVVAMASVETPAGPMATLDVDALGLRRLPRGVGHCPGASLIDLKQSLDRALRNIGMIVVPDRLWHDEGMGLIRNEHWMTRAWTAQERAGVFG